MTGGTGRVLTTHTGSLPRSPQMSELLDGGDRSERFDAAAREAVAETVAHQREVGLDIVNDGEVSKPSFATYVTERLGGFESQAARREPAIETDLFPGFYGDRGFAGGIEVMTCVGPVTWRGDAQIERDLDNLSAALADHPGADAFVSAASPGTVWYYQPDAHHESHEAYVMAVADAMKHEYDAIHGAGFMLQLDCPDLAGGWNRRSSAHFSVDDFRAFARTHIEALNHATRDIPSERMRMHVCWGNYEGPHVRDIPLAEIVDVLLTARPEGLSIEGANPRHAHEWALFAESELPADKVLIPGVIDSTTNYVEHPELVAQRIVRYAEVVGREHVIAGCDCGFATLGKSQGVHPEVAWAKLAALTEGAALASARLWS